MAVEPLTMVIGLYGCDAHKKVGNTYLGYVLIIYVIRLLLGLINTNNLFLDSQRYIKYSSLRASLSSVRFLLTNQILLVML